MTKHFFTVLGVAIVLAACTAPQPPQPVTTRNSDLTHGNVQMRVQVGETTQADILESFGAPNVTTIDGANQEVWTYQRAATVTQDSSNYNYWTILFAGSGNESSGFEQTSRMTTLIIKFDENNVVSDFRSRSSNF
ncbi:MAG: hypothetical protein ACR2RE_03015 [Geminicoccaceae bacterium]